MLAKISYYKLRALLENKSYPIAFVDLDGLDKNFELFARAARENNKKIRIASKSIRVPYLLKYIFEKDRDLFSGIMCYRIKEAKFLYSQGFNDLLIAYPEVSPVDLDILADMTRVGCRVSLVVDSVEHLQLLDEAGRKNEVKLNIILELDGSLRLLDGKINLGVRRSSIRNTEDLKDRLWFIQRKKYLNLAGIMLYEAQVAGLADNGPWSSYQNPIKRKIKSISVPKVEEFRQQSLELIRQEGFNPEIINGGGTGSIFTSTKDSTLTEVTVGSGFLCSHLFSYYQGLDLTPAVFFAIQVVRQPDSDYITCQGGGFIASGSMGADRQPEVFLPLGIEATELEGFGEVQSPFKIVDKKTQISIGDPVILRHAKAGELAEHFNSYYLFRNNEIIGQESTYRGLGHNFL
jgi:D-serine deaminase-like pyridoxal phosphate-dependent protein